MTSDVVTNHAVHSASDATGIQGFTVTSLSQANAITLEKEIDWFTRVLDLRIRLYFEQGADLDHIYQIPPPTLSENDSVYAQVVCQYQLNFDERIVLVMALLPHIRPQILDTFFIQNSHFDRGYTEFGGIQGKSHSGFLPTCETAAFVLAGDELSRRFAIMPMFETQHIFARAGILSLEHHNEGEPFFSSVLALSGEYLNKFTTGITEKLDYSSRFPAKLITTALGWQDLVLAPEVMEEIDKIRTWIRSSEQILNKWQLEKTLKPGYRALFYGPPGTGKTLTATLLGDELGLDVYRIDLSSMISKYIGETEKNLAGLFDQAQNKNWILFFDEADSLFGARSGGSSANDRHANQQVAYLLQRIEDFPGVVILATNLRASIDDAFSRRFQSLIYFPLPDAEQRLELWQKILNGHYAREEANELQQLAEEYELAGGAIINVVRYAAISALQVGSDTMRCRDLRAGIARELRKEGKTI
ncbi:ATP-binding protein [Oceanospirillum sp. D5]|uniref:ATP-binding protein n=2 Tax=Oceanospirillum sediminis TaxID=2760088 RepID=A0A839IR39_9GAMM|nr:ATP-binding protein [Oceanospirillum sediminis]